MFPVDQLPYTMIMVVRRLGEKVITSVRRTVPSGQLTDGAS